MPRLFTAIELPDDMRQRLRRLRTPLPGAKWVEPENLHLTLRFAGDVGNLVASEFVDALSRIEVDAFEMRIAGLGAFGGNDPHAIFAGVEPSPALDALARANERAARGAGLPAESRTFKPHVTLARLKHYNAEAVAKFLARASNFRPERFSAERFVLMSSRPKTGGGPYVVEEAFPLRGAYSNFVWPEPAS